jgi:Golgi phosphoprotein 3
VFSSRRYPTLDGAGRKEVKTRLRELLLGDGVPDPRDVVLVSLLSACRLFGQIFDETELPKVQPRIQAVARMDLIGQAIAAIIGEIEHEVTLALGHLG